MGTVEKIYPTVEECKTNSMLKCTENGCTSVFVSESNLTLHLAKTHKKVEVMMKTGMERHYHCPDLNCQYNLTKHFKNLKYLRQHFLKVHTEKNFNCGTCNRSFPNDNSLRMHNEYCGVDFTCCDCNASYGCYETLKTHCRRKKHNILNKREYKANTNLKCSKSDNLLSSKGPIILTKPCTSVPMMSMLTKSMNQESQTQINVPLLKTKMTQVNRDTFLVNQNTQHTQTGSQNVQFTVETQTLDDFAKTFQKTESFEENDSQKCANTQTDVIESKSTSCNTTFILDNVPLKPQVEKSSSSTQTQCELQNIYSTSTATHDSICTDTSDLLSRTLAENLSNFENNFYNCHTETQTDFMLQDDLFTCDYYSNMYTQTCDEILNGLGFSDIQTQTVIEDVLKSVESQTMMSHANINAISCKDMANIETQTDSEFRQMLEIINS